jgi:D-glycero-D-manno-heptose 1,7-bisphosphate phosphatase
MKPAIFLDRDDTIIKNVPYLGDPSQVRILPGVPEALDHWEKAGFSLFIISNQSGVGRGLITKEQVLAVNDEMNRQLGKNFFAAIYNCYAAPEDPWSAEERKPSPGLVRKAILDHDLDLTRSFMVGDRLSDVQCGKNAGCRSVLVLTGDPGKEQDEAKRVADFIADGLLQAAEWTLSNKK